MGRRGQWCALVCALGAGCSLATPLDHLTSEEGTTGAGASSTGAGASTATGSGAASAAGGAGTSAGGAGCPSGTADCNDEPGCETDTNTLEHCGGCNEVCASIGGTATCDDGTCVLACDASRADCNGSGADGCEVFTSNDTKHCGGCEHDCLGKPCDEGLCAPELLVQGAGSVANIAVDDTYVYWTDIDGALMRADLLLWSAETLVSGLDKPHSIALDADFLYWSNLGDPAMGYDGQIMRRALFDGATVLLASAVKSTGLARGPQHVYFADGTTIDRVSVGGGSSSQLFSTAINVLELAVTSDKVFFVTATTVGWIPATGGSEVVLASGQANAIDIAVDATDVYWVNLGTVDSGYTDGAVMKVSQAGGNPTQLVSNLEAPNRIAIDGTHVYFLEGEGVKVGRIAKAGGAPIVLAAGVSGYWEGLTLWDAHVYWGDYGNGRLWRVPK